MYQLKDTEGCVTAVANIILQLYEPSSGLDTILTLSQAQRLRNKQCKRNSRSAFSFLIAYIFIVHSRQSSFRVKNERLYIMSVSLHAFLVRIGKNMPSAQTFLFTHNHYYCCYSHYTVSSGSSEIQRGRDGPHHPEIWTIDGKIRGVGNKKYINQC